MKKEASKGLSLILAVVMIVIITSSIATAKQFEIQNTAPIADLSADVLYKNNVNFYIVTDYQGQDMVDVKGRLNTIKTNFKAKGVIFDYTIIDFNSLDGSTDFGNSGMNNYVVFMSDGVGSNFNFSAINKVLANRLANNNFNVYAITPQVNWDYISPNTDQDITIRQLVGIGEKGELYDNTDSPGVPIFKNFLMQLLVGTSNKHSSLFPDDNKPMKKLDLMIATDYTGAKLSELEGYANEMKSKAYPYGVDLDVKYIKDTKGIPKFKRTDLTGYTVDLNERGNIFEAPTRIFRIVNGFLYFRIYCQRYHNPSEDSGDILIRGIHDCKQVNFTSTEEAIVLSGDNTISKVHILGIDQLPPRGIDYSVEQYSLGIYSNEKIIKIVHPNDFDSSTVLALTRSGKLLTISSNGVSTVKNFDGNSIKAIDVTKTAVLDDKGNLYLHMTGYFRDYFGEPREYKLDYEYAGTGVGSLLDQNGTIGDWELVRFKDGRLRCFYVTGEGYTGHKITSSGAYIDGGDYIGQEIVMTDYNYMLYKDTRGDIKRKQCDNPGDVVWRGEPAFYIEPRWNSDRINVDSSKFLYFVFTPPTWTEGAVGHYSHVDIYVTTNSQGVTGLYRDADVPYSHLETTMLDTSKIISTPIREGADAMALLVSDGGGANLVDDYGKYFSFGFIDNSLKNYLTSKGIKTYVSSPSADHNFILKQPTIPITTQQVTLEDLTNSTGGKLFDKGNYKKAIEDMLLPYMKIEDSNKSGHILINENALVYKKSYNDYEQDCKGKNILYGERWRYNHNPNVFDRNQGYISDNNIWGSVSIVEINEKVFDKVGKYIISYQAQDDPTSNNYFANYRRLSLGENQIEIYACRRPVAQFNYILDGINLSLTNTSFDLDHHLDADKGIVDEQWKYKKLSDNNWTIGKPTVLDAGETYVVYLTVKDKDGFISYPHGKIIGVQDNTPPVALFSLENNKMDKGSSNKITDMSYDPDNDPIVEWHWWVTNKDGNKVINKTSRSKDDVPNLSVLNIGDYTMHLQVTDDPSQRGKGLPICTSKVYSESFSIGINNKPIALFTLEKPFMIKGSPNKIIDKSYDPDGDPIVEWHWWVIDKNTGRAIDGFNDIQNIPDLSKLNIGRYTIKLQVKDNPAWGVSLTSDPYSLDLDVTINDLAVDAVPRSMDWINRSINANIIVTGGYNYRRTYYMWSKSPLVPSALEFMAGNNYNHSRSFDAVLNNIKVNEGIWYLHMLAEDDLGSVYNRTGVYKLDVTAPIINYSIDNSTLNVLDELSGVDEVYYKWADDINYAREHGFSEFAKWNGELVNKPFGYQYLHVKAIDKARNSSYKVFGPFIDPLKLENFRIIEMINPPFEYNLPIHIGQMPVGVMAGYRNRFNIDVEGIAENIKVDISDNYNNNLGSVNMYKVKDINDNRSIWEFNYVPALNTEKGTIIKFHIVGNNGDVVYDYNIHNPFNGNTLKIIGNALQDLRIFRRY